MSDNRGNFNIVVRLKGHAGEVEVQQQNAMMVYSAARVELSEVMAKAIDAYNALKDSTQ